MTTTPTTPVDAFTACAGDSTCEADHYYWCPRCEREVAAGCVRHDGTHDGDGCGSDVEERCTLETYDDEGDRS